MKLWRATAYRTSGIMRFFSSKLCAIFWRIMGQKYLIMRIAQYFEEQIFNLLNLQIFFGFTFKTKLSISKRKHGEKKLFCRQLNRSRRLFSFPGCDWLRFFQSWRVLYKRTSAQVPTASSLEHLGHLVHLWTLFSTKRWLFTAKMYYIIREKAFPCISQCWKKTWLTNIFVKIFQNYAPLFVLSELCQLCAQGRIMRFRIRA